MSEFLPKLRDKTKLRKGGLFSKAVLSLFVPSSHSPFLLLRYFFQAPTATRAPETIMSLECLRMFKILHFDIDCLQTQPILLILSFVVHLKIASIFFSCV